MLLMLSSFAKTVPSNHNFVGIEVTEEGPPGFSCTPEQWEKAKRMEDPHYDWGGYQNLTVPKGDHPDYINRAKEAELVNMWEGIVRTKEPLRRGP